MRGRGLSRFREVGWVVMGLGAVFLVGCASAKQAEVKRLHAQSAFERGVAEFLEGRLALALPTLQEAIQLDPTVAEYHNSLGLVYLGLERLPDAQEAFTRALELNPRYGEARHNLGVAYAEQGKWQEAVREYRAALSLTAYANLENTYHSLGWAYLNLGRLREAEESFRLVLKLDPNRPATQYYLGFVLLKAGRRDEAREAFRRARELAQDSPLGRSAQEQLKALGEGG